MKENVYFHLLKHRNFMAFWGATTLLRLASNILQFALAIYVLDLTGSAFVYSTVLSVIILPRILCTSFAGYLADFKDSLQLLRRCTLVVTCMIACFLIIHVLVIPLNIPLIYALVISLELCETFQGPTEAKILFSIVTEEEIAPASKISSLDDGIVEILPPVIAALFYGYFGLTGILSITLVLEGITFLLAIIIRASSNQISVMEDTTQVSSVSINNTFNAYKETILCLKNHPYAIGVILFAPLFNFFINPLFSVTAPHYFRVTMQADVDLYALFNIILGIAGVVAPFLAMALIRDNDEYKANKGGTVFSAVVLFCLSSILYFENDTISTNVALYTVTGAMACLVVIVTIMNIASSITIKKNIPEQIIGRVFSIIQLCATLSIPLGQLFYGVCIDQFPITISYLISILGLVITFAVMSWTYRIINKNKESKRE